MRNAFWRCAVRAHSLLPPFGKSSYAPVLVIVANRMWHTHKCAILGCASPPPHKIFIFQLLCNGKHYHRCKRWLGTPDPALTWETWCIRWLLPWVIDGKTFTFSVSPPHLVKSHQLLTGTIKLERLPGPYCDAYQSFEETLKFIGIALLTAHSLVLKWVLRIPPPPVWPWSWVMMKQSSPGHLNSLFYHFLFLTCQVLSRYDNTHCAHR